jgi:hypothetical protein
MKFGSFASHILTNKWVLNIVSVLAFLNVIGYVVIGDVESVALFIIVAVLLGNFSRNMIIVLGVPLILVNMVVFKNRSYGIEGLDNMMSDADKKKAEDDKKKEEDKKKADKKKDDDKKKDADATNTIGTIKEKKAEEFEVGRAKNGSSKIDYAATVEGAYDDLNKILGSEGMKSLTGDTQRLMQQQLDLAESMKAMTPILEQMGPMLKQAEGMLGNLGGTDGLSGLASMVGKLTGGKKE